MMLELYKLLYPKHQDVDDVETFNLGFCCGLHNEMIWGSRVHELMVLLFEGAPCLVHTSTCVCIYTVHQPCIIRFHNILRYC